MLRIFVSLLMLTALAVASAVDPIPPGTEFGSVYVLVTDCVSGAPIQGASVNLDNPTHRTSALTNSTGYATLGVFAWFYSYYVTASGYRIEAGQRRFALDEVFRVCLVPEAAGFWRVVATVLAWQGDIHAGGHGWAIIRLKNLEAGVFNITEFQIWVAGFDEPAIIQPFPNGIILDRLVDKDVNVTINPRQEIPTGRLKAELRFRATFTGADGRVIGPLTVSTDLDYVVIAPYRSFKLRVVDYWGTNPVPEAVVEMIPTLPGINGTFLYRSDGQGYIDIRRQADGAYLTRIYYLSPFDQKIYQVNQLYTILEDLAKTPSVKTSLYEAHVNVRDLAGRPLETQVFLNDVESFSSSGVAKFVNVPAGNYKVVVKWLGVDVFESKVKVSEPLVLNSPGGALDATAQVGDIGVRLLTSENREVTVPVKMRLTPFDRTAENVSTAVFSQLPKGTYRLEIQAYNSFKNNYVVVGEKTFVIPADHGEHIVQVGVFDTVVELVDKSGRKVELMLTVDGKQVNVRDGTVALRSITSGTYRFIGVWRGFKVLDTLVDLRPMEKTVVTAEIYSMKIRVIGVDGLPIVKARSVMRIGETDVERSVVNGTVVFDEVPSGRHMFTVYLDGAEVFKDFVTAAPSSEAVANAGYVEILFKDQRGSPVAGVLLQSGDIGSNTTKADGVARLAQKPLGSYRFTAKYRGFTLFEAVAKAGNRTEFVLPLYSFKVVVVDEFNNGIEATISVSRDDVPLGIFTASEASFVGLPPGTYIVRAAVGTKHVEQPVLLTSDGQTFTVNVPVAFVFGNVVLSTSEVLTIAVPVAVFAVGVLSVIALTKITSRKSKRPKGRL